MSKVELVSLVARFGMAAVWIAAGLSKTGNFLQEHQAIMAYDIFNPTWSGYLAHIIGPVELIGGLMLLLGIFQRHASKVAAVALVLFMVGIAQAWARGLAIDCGCFGSTSPEDNLGMNYFLTLVRDAVFLAATVWLIYVPCQRFALGR